jgi:hypothetical protein
MSAELSLEASIEAFGDALSRADIEAAKRFAAEDLSIITLSGGLVQYDRRWWEEMVPNFQLSSFELERDVITRRERQAVHSRLGRMTSKVGEMERTGMFSITDHWTYCDGQGWTMWQRVSVPVVDEAPVPEEF